MWTDKQYEDLKSKLKTKIIDLSGLNPGTSIIDVDVPKNRFLDVVKVVIELQAIGGGEVEISLTSAGQDLTDEVLRIKGTRIRFFQHGFYEGNDSRIISPIKFNPNEVIELQRYIKDVAFAGTSENGSRMRIRVYNNSTGNTTPDSIIRLSYIERGL